MKNKKEVLMKSFECIYMKEGIKGLEGTIQDLVKSKDPANLSIEYGMVINLIFLPALLYIDKKDVEEYNCMFERVINQINDKIKKTMKEMSEKLYYYE